MIEKNFMQKKKCALPCMPDYSLSQRLHCYTIKFPPAFFKSLWSSQTYWDILLPLGVGKNVWSIIQFEVSPLTTLDWTNSLLLISPQYEYILIWLLLFSIYHQISLLLFLAEIDVNSCMLISNVVQKHFVERKMDSISPFIVSPFLYGLLCEVAILDAAQFSCDDGHESCSVMNEFFKIVVEVWIVIFTDPFWHTNRNSLKSQFRN